MEKIDFYCVTNFFRTIEVSLPVKIGPFFMPKTSKLRLILQSKHTVQTTCHSLSIHAVIPSKLKIKTKVTIHDQT